MFPLISEYIEAIKSAEDNFNELSYLKPVLDEDGLPEMTSGNFAVVFKMKDEQSGELYALKCFTKEQEGRAEAYREIAKELKDISSPYLVSIRYLDKELFVDTDQTTETEFPVLLMDWVEGKTLDKYLRENLDNKYFLEMLAYRFSQLAQWLILQPFAHGDLKPDNILVRENGALVLIDYDGMYVPSMKGQKARELGSPNFRHPSRNEDLFNEKIDDFAIALIALSLKVFSINVELVNDFCSNDFFLFRVEDYVNLNSCGVMVSIHNIFDDDELKLLFGIFMIVYAKKTLDLMSPKLFMLKNPKTGLAYAEYVYNQARNICEEGKDKKQIDHNKAFVLFKEAAIIGNADAQCCVGCCYRNGYGTQIDYTEARVWYDISAQNGCARALRHIGFCYRDGIGVKKDINKAFEYFTKAVDSGDISSMIAKGDIYKYSLTNYNEAVKCYTRAAERGHSEGMWKLGICYEHGSGVTKCYEKASYWYNQSALKKNKYGQSSLAYCYYYGKGVEVDKNKALYWMEQAAKQGLDSAIITYNQWCNYWWDGNKAKYSKDKRTLYSIENDVVEYDVLEGTINIADNGASSYNLKRMIIPKSICTIGKTPFRNKVDIICNSPNFEVANSTLYSKGKKVLIQCVIGDADEFIIPEGVEIIDDFAFSYCSIKKIVIPSSVREIKKNPFMMWGEFASYDLHLEIINYSNSFSIVDNALYLNDKLISYWGEESYFEIPDGIREIGSYAFRDGELKAIKLPSSIEKIAEDAFDQLHSIIEWLEIPIYIPPLKTEKFKSMLPECFHTKLIELNYQTSF